MKPIRKKGLLSRSAAGNRFVLGLPAKWAGQTAIVVLTALFVWAPHRAEAGTEVAQWILVTAPAFRETLAPLVEYRRAEGLKVVLLESTNVLTPEQIRQTNAQPLQAHLSRLFQQHQGPSYALLVGAVAVAEPALVEATVLPPLWGTTGDMQGQPSDHAFGCPDSNGVPAVAVGRFPARTLEEARGMVQKTLRLEQARRPAPWRNRLVVLGGNPGGGPLAEMLYEMVAGPRIRRLHPAWNVRALVHSSQSIYYLPSTQLHDAAIRYLEEGELFSVYLGHSNPSGMVSGTTRFLDRADWANLKIDRGPGVFFTTACSSCRLDGSGGEGYGLAAMRNPNGPVAVIGAHHDSYSALGLLALEGFVRGLSTPPFAPRLADYWLAVKAGLAGGEIAEGLFKMLDAADGSSGKTPLAVQRREHLEMWMLLGDPALRLPLVPLDIRLDPAGPVSAGQRLTVTGALPDRLAGAPVRLTLERAFNAKPADLEKLPPRGSENRERVVMQNHRRANNVVLASAGTTPNGTRFACPVEVPLSLTNGSVLVRVEAETATEAALGVMNLKVSR